MDNVLSHLWIVWEFKKFVLLCLFVQEGEEFLKKQKTSNGADHQEEVEAQWYCYF